MGEEVACMSQLLKNMVEDSGADEEFPLPNVKTAILGKVLDYCKFHKDEPPEEIQKPLKSANLAECGVREWDVEFVNVEQEILSEIILAANYLDIESLLDLTCAKVASMIKGNGVVAESEIRSPSKLRYFTCAVCRVECNSDAQFEQHLQSKRHLKKFKRPCFAGLVKNSMGFIPKLTAKQAVAAWFAHPVFAQTDETLLKEQILKLVGPDTWLPRES